MWRAYSLYTQIYTRNMYSHILRIDVKKERFYVIRRLSTLVPFCVTLFTIFLSALFYLYLPITYALGRNENVPLFKVVAHFYISCLFFLSLGLNILTYTHGFEIYQLYCSAQFWFHRKLRRDHGSVSKIFKTSINGINL